MKVDEGNMHREEYHELKRELAIVIESTKHNTEGIVYLQNLVQQHLNSNTAKVIEHETKIKNIEQWKDSLPKSIALMVSIIQLIVGGIFAFFGYHLGKGGV